MGIKTQNKYGLPSLLVSGYVAKVNILECNACGMCKNRLAFRAKEVETVVNGTNAWVAEYALVSVRQRQ